MYPCSGSQSMLKIMYSMGFSDRCSILAFLIVFGRHIFKGYFTLIHIVLFFLIDDLGFEVWSYGVI